jgi:hypothetical protein
MSRGEVWKELAAEHGQYQCLVFLHGQHCSWGKDTCVKAAKNGHLSCLRFAIQHGCSYNKKELIRVTTDEVCKAYVSGLHAPVSTLTLFKSKLSSTYFKISQEES